MEESGDAVLEAFRIPHGLFHRIGYVQPLNSLAFNMDSWQSYYIRFRAKANRSSRSRGVSVAVQQSDKFQLPGSAFAL